MRVLDGRFGEQMGTEKGVYLDMMLKEIPAGHLGDAADIANVVSFLASKESHYITGQSVSPRMLDYENIHAELLTADPSQWWDGI